MQRWLRAILGPYTVFVILADDLQNKSSLPLHAMFEASDASAGQKLPPGSWHFSYIQENTRLCTCAVWYGERYQSRNYWPLQADECKLISLETIPQAKGQGIAPIVIAQVSRQMAILGFRTIYARVWHSNKASLRAFAKSGWQKHALVIDVFPGGHPMRAVIPLQWLRWLRQ